MEFEKNTEVLRSILKSLSHDGYTRLHFPGGTSKDGSFASTVVVPYYDTTTKTVYFCCVPYIPGKKGDDNGHTKKAGETWAETARRELFEETGLQAEIEDFFLFHSVKINDNRPGCEGKIHTKNFYLLEKFNGNLFDFKGANPIDSETAAPIMIPANMLMEYLFKGHTDAAKKAIEELMGRSAEYAMALMNIF